MEIVVRIIVIYIFLMVALRIIGKREFGQLEPFELVTLLLIPHLVSDALVPEGGSLVTAFIAVSTLLALVFTTSVLAYLSRRFGRVVDGEPTVLVQHGFLVPESMNQERVSPEEITAEMHKSGLERLSQVKWAVLETDGKITFVPWHPGDTHRRAESKEIA